MGLIYGIDGVCFVKCCLPLAVWFGSVLLELRFGGDCGDLLVFVLYWLD